MGRDKRITIREVANLAKVSPATVSLVINKTGAIGKLTSQRVENAMIELNYRPNIVARGLRSRKTATIGLILSNIDNSFYPSVARGVEDLANEKGYNVILCNTDEDPDKERRYIEELSCRQVDGYLLVPTRDFLSNLELIRKINRPVVLLDRYIDDCSMDAVLLDNYHGAYEACVHLIQIHHCRKIGTIAGPADLTTGRERLNGYRDALFHGNLSYSDDLVGDGDFTEQGGYEMCMKLMEQNPDMDALFVANNLMCIGALKYLFERGVKIPEHLRVICFDEMPWSRLIAPALTTVAQSTYSLGKLSASILLKRLQGESFPHMVHRIPIELIIRESCGCVNNK